MPTALVWPPALIMRWLSGISQQVGPTKSGRSKKCTSFTARVSSRWIAASSRCAW